MGYWAVATIKFIEELLDFPAPGKGMAKHVQEWTKLLKDLRDCRSAQGVKSHFGKSPGPFCVSI